jgi:inner membrane protein involved in colicin E2 resistance
MKDLIDHERVAQRLWLILFLFNMLVCAYSRHVGWMLFWAIAFSSCAYKYGYEYGKRTKATAIFLESREL